MRIQLASIEIIPNKNQNPVPQSKPLVRINRVIKFSDQLVDIIGEFIVVIVEADKYSVLGIR